MNNLVLICLNYYGNVDMFVKTYVECLIELVKFVIEIISNTTFCSMLTIMCQTIYLYLNLISNCDIYLAEFRFNFLII